MSPSRRRVLTVLQWSLLGLLVAGVVAGGAWRMGGGRWERVETASMGTVAPVNSLLWVEPVSPSALRVGDFVTFHPPGQAELSYSHRIAAIHRDGTFETQGEISSRDPWRVGGDDLVGRVVMTWYGVGWLVVAAPVLLGGGLLLGLVVWSVRERSWRLPVGIVGAALVLSVAIVVHRPLIRAQELGFAEVPGGARATYVSTGLAPVRLQAHRGPHVDLRDGEVGSVLITHRDDAGRYGISMHPRIPLWWWVVLVSCCFLPALGSLARRDTTIGAHALDRSLRAAR
ncbi:S26 family signal peptidase [Nocardioides albidus]|uniref:S26 family signal peptidase n=1 Tax=Nocardioides albidus TaxID=1517589 RepID=A0A5C4VW20_9ACTN|nr:S26 family signal peptidase [Nocardioides albidus]TNM39489.1 S26 family signal peptidase [Nocardioides albidus]